MMRKHYTGCRLCWWLQTLAALYWLVSVVQTGSHERDLINLLLHNYNPLERPVANESDILNVTFGITLQQIIDLDEKNQVLLSNVWLKYQWVDFNLKWNPEDYGGVTDVRISTDRMWIPDVLMYNSADERFDSSFRTNVVVYSNGSCLYIPPGVFKSTCQIDITWFPFDDQKCDMKFGSWTYDGFAVDLQKESDHADTSPYLPNGEWVLVDVPSIRTSKFYECCPAPYIDITFTIHMKRRTLYYGFNLIIPCIILSSMTLLSFSLPPESGEKLHLGVTILLSMTVFLVQLGKILPATSDSVSIIAIYFGSIMVMVAFSVVMTVVVLNFHHRSSETKEMSEKVKKILLNWLPRILGMERPGIKPPKKCLKNSSKKLAAFCGGGGGKMINFTKPGPLLSPATIIPYVPDFLTGFLGPAGTTTMGNNVCVNLDPIMVERDQYLQNNQIIDSIYEHEDSCMFGRNQRKENNNPQHIGELHPEEEGSKGTGSKAELDFEMQTMEADDLDLSVSLQSDTNGSQSTRAALKASQPTKPAKKTSEQLHSQQGGGGRNKQKSVNSSLEPDVASKKSAHQELEHDSHHHVHHQFMALKRRHKLLEILLEMRFITDRLRQEDVTKDVIAEWRYAATVLDRLCLIMFSLFTMLSLGICLISAPQLIV